MCVQCDFSKHSGIFARCACSDYMRVSSCRRHSEYDCTCECYWFQIDRAHTGQQSERDYLSGVRIPQRNADIRVSGLLES